MVCSWQLAVEKCLSLLFKNAYNYRGNYKHDMLPDFVYNDN